MSGPAPRPALVGRRAERERLSGLVAAAKAGRSQAVVLRGEAGIGKTALLEFVLERAVGCRVGRAAGIESETEFPFAGLHQLCRPFVDRLGRLPVPQQQALGTAFGLQPGGVPDRFLVGLAVLTLLSEVAEERPLVCLVDDAQWLDQASAQALEFVARRLAAEPVAMVFATRESEDEPVLTGLPEMVLQGLSARDSEALLDSAMTGTLDPRVRDRILAESHGNPLALLELPRGLPAGDLAFGVGVGVGATGKPLVGHLEEGFLRQVVPLPRQSRQLLLAAAADPVGDVPLLWRAVERLGVGTEAAAAAEASGLIELRDRVRFRHPLARSAVYRSATRGERREVHRVIADVMDADLDPDRRAWHRACAAAGPDEAVATVLEGSAGRALTHGGLAAAAAFLERAAMLTPDPVRRTRRSLDAARAKVAVGRFDEASALLATAGMGPLGDADGTRIDLVQAQMSFAADRGDKALPLFLSAARRLELLDADVARDTYLDSMSAALSAGRLAVGPGVRVVAEAVRAAPPARAPRRSDLLLEGLAVLFTDGYAPAASGSRRAVRMFVEQELTLEEALRSGWPAAATAASLWDDAAWDLLTQRHLQVVRDAGAMSALPWALTGRVLVHLFTGDLAAATSLVDEIQGVAETTGGEIAPAPYAEVSVAAVRGHADRAEPLIQLAVDDVTDRGEGMGVTMIRWAQAVLSNGLGRYDVALRAAAAAAADPLELAPPKWALAELVEAGVRSGDRAAAYAAFDTLSAMTTASGSDWALGTEASRRALLLDGSAAEDHYLEAIDRLARTTVQVELARAQLLYGEWLRRQGRRVDARGQLRSAYEKLATMGLDAFAERARHELLATGETVRKRSVETSGDLTDQETRIAGLVGRGLTNPEIGAALFLSPRTVEWHLRKVFAKLGVSTRRELRRVLTDALGTAEGA